MVSSFIVEKGILQCIASPSTRRSISGWRGYRRRTVQCFSTVDSAFTEHSSTYEDVTHSQSWGLFHIPFSHWSNDWCRPSHLLTIWYLEKIYLPPLVNWVESDGVGGLVIVASYNLWQQQNDAITLITPPPSFSKLCATVSHVSRHFWFPTSTWSRLPALSPPASVPQQGVVRFETHLVPNLQLICSQSVWSRCVFLTCLSLVRRACQKNL